MRTDAARDYYKNVHRVELRYFDCRGRGQALRYVLAEHFPGYIDTRVPVGDFPKSWTKMKQDRLFSGPFGALPVLVFDVTEVAQTLVIADYLARKLGHYPEDDRARLIQQMATSAAFSDLIEPYAHLFWLYPEKPRELERRISQHAHRTRECIERLEELLPITGPYFGGSKPAVADYFVLDAVRTGLAVFGRYEHGLLSRAPRIHALCRELEHLPRIRAEIARAPLNVTGSPREAEIREMIDTLAEARP